MKVEDVLGVLVEEARVQVRRLLAGGGVDRGPEPVEALGDLDRRVARGPLEKQVLEEVRDPGLRRGLVPGAGPDPEPERAGADRGNLLGHDPHARAELVELGAGQLAAALTFTAAASTAVAAVAPAAVAGADRGAHPRFAKQELPRP